MAEREEQIARIRRLQQIARIKGLQQAVAAQQPQEPEGAGQAALEAFGQSATLGALPALQAAAEPAQTALLNALTGGEVESPEFQESLEANIARQAQQAEQFPGATTAGNIGGALAGGGLAGAGVRGLGRAVAPGIAKGLAGAGLAGRVGALGAEGAALGAAGTTGEAIGRGELPTGEQLQSGAALGGGIGAAFPVAGRALSKAGGLGTKAVSAAFGVRQEAIAKFIKNASRIKNAKDKDEVALLAEDAVSEIKKKAEQEGLDAVFEIQQGLNNLKQQGLLQADEALEVLANSKFDISKKELIRIVRSARGKFLIGGKAPLGKSAQTAVKELKNLENGLEVFDDKVSAVDLKSILKQLDRDIDFLQVPGTFTKSQVQQGLQAIRSQIDRRLKNDVPGYANKVGDAAKTFSLLEESSKRFGKQEQALSAITSLGKPGKPIKDKILKEFAREGNVDLDRFRAAQENARQFGNWQGQTLEGKIRNLMGERSAAVRKQFEKLSQMADFDFIQAIDDLGVKTQFEQEFLRGSRNVNLWTVIGAGAGGFIGGPVTGAAGGAVIGGLIDKNGPRIARKILEQVSRIKGLPSVQKIEQLELPSGVKRDLVNDLRAALIVKAAPPSSTEIPVQLRPKVRRDIALSESMTNAEKAKNLSRLNKRGEVVDLKKMVFGDKIVPQGPEPLITTRKPAPKEVSVESVADFTRYRRRPEF